MKRSFLVQFVSAAVLLSMSTLAWGFDTAMLKPPKGSKVAIIAFEDLECPQCAKAAPLLHEAAKKYNVPLVQYDFPLKQHPWSYEAAVNARFFDSKSLKLGDDYRLYIFQNQNSITKQNLRGVTEKWASDHGVTLPFVVDPSGQFSGKVEADRQMGERIPLQHTPTVYIVNDSGHGTPVMEVTDLTQLYQMLDEAVKAAGTTTEAHKPAAQAKKSSPH
jgi:protein-disulfide isomerase